jgi:hypothetical protein
MTGGRLILIGQRQFMKASTAWRPVVAKIGLGTLSAVETLGRQR